MGLKVIGLSSVRSRLIRTESKTNKASLRVFRAGAAQILKRAKEYAPVDEGDLENSLEKIENRTGSHRRTNIQIGVNPNKLGDGYSVYGFRYDVRQHEDTSLGRGPKSQEKAERIGKNVGPKYLSRALKDFEKDVDESIKKAVRDAIK